MVRTGRERRAGVGRRAGPPHTTTLGVGNINNVGQYDPERIALMGFSRGAIATLYGSMKRFQRMHGPTTGVNFAGYIPFYASCNS